MITPRITRLIRVPDLHDFRRVIAALCASPWPADDGAWATGLPSRLVVIPTRSAATTLTRTLDAFRAADAERLRLVTRDELYDALHARLADPPRRLSAFERDAMAQAAALDAARDVGELPFTVRPGLVAELLRFYDQLRRQSQQVRRFEELITEALGGGDLDDSGAERLLRQTRFLAQTFRGYEQRATATDACDEHRLRERLLADDAARPLAHVIVTVPDWIADPAGLFVADFDLLNRLPNLGTIDIVSTEGALASGFHERLDTWWPGIEEVTAHDLVAAEPPARPMLVVPEPTPESAPLWFTHRDREEELLTVTRRLLAEPPASLDAVAVVFKRPLPYLYLAADTLGAAGIPHVVADALPLAAEPAVATVDLVLDALEADFPRDSVIALLRSPHLVFASRVGRVAIGALDRSLSDARYLGDSERLEALAAHWANDAPESRRRGTDPRVTARAAMVAAVDLVRALRPLRTAAPASELLGGVLAFFEAHLLPLDDGHPLVGRERRARAAVGRILREMASAHAAHHNPHWTVADLATSIRRWIGDETFVQEGLASGVRLLDDQAARYGTFADLTIVGLIESEWPDRPRRNIFYPPNLLKALELAVGEGPARCGRRPLPRSAGVGNVAGRAVGVPAGRRSDRLALHSTRRSAARPPLDRAAPGVERAAAAGRGARLRHGSGLARRARGAGVARTANVPRARRRPVVPRHHRSARRDHLVGQRARDLHRLPLQVLRAVHPATRRGTRRRRGHGPAASGAVRARSVRNVLQGVAGMPGTARSRPDCCRSPANASPPWSTAPSTACPKGRRRSSGRVCSALRLPEDWARRCSAWKPSAPCRLLPRLLEHRLEGPVTIQTADGPRTIQLRGKADRVDLLADGTFRLIDYKLGWPPDRGKALQLPIYALCAEQQLAAQGRAWTLGEAVYLAFKGPKRVVPLFSNDAARAETLAKAQQRMADTLDAIARGDFPPSPDDVYRCEHCSFSTVCRRDYVGDI